jgi:hypothetical protein
MSSSLIRFRRQQGEVRPRQGGQGVGGLAGPCLSALRSELAAALYQKSIRREMSQLPQAKDGDRSPVALRSAALGWFPGHRCAMIRRRGHTAKPPAKVKSGS